MVGLGVGDCHFIRDHGVKTVQLTSSDHPKIRNFIKALNFRLTDQPKASLGALRRPDEEESFISSHTRGNDFFLRLRELLNMCSKRCWLRNLAQGSKEMPSPLLLPAHFFLWSATRIKTWIRNAPHPSPVPYSGIKTCIQLWHIKASFCLCMNTTFLPKLRPHNRKSLFTSFAPAHFCSCQQSLQDQDCCNPSPTCLSVKSRSSSSHSTYHIQILHHSFQSINTATFL